MNELTTLSDKLAEMTDNNDHVNALITVANFLELTRIESRLMFIRTKQEHRGYIDHFDSNEKQALFQELMLAGESSYGNDWNIVYQSL